MDNPLKCVVASSNLYFFKYLPTENIVSAFRENRKTREKFFSRICSILLKFFGYRQSRTLVRLILASCKKKYNRELIQLIEEDRPMIIFDGCCGMDLLYLSKYYNNKNYAVYLWNKANKDNLKFSKIINKDKIFSYSSEDANKYGLKHIQTFYTKNIFLDSEKLDYDCYFLGKLKGRFELLSVLSEKLDSIDLRCSIDIFDNSNVELPKGFNRLESYMSYDDYLNKIARSRAIIEVAGPNKNITLRPLESIFFRKKLITNNKYLVDYDFYHPDNILIYEDVDQLTKENLTTFFNKPYREIDEKILMDYDFSTFLSKFEKEFDIR